MNKGHDKDGKPGARHGDSPQSKRREEMGDDFEAVSESTRKKVENPATKRGHGGVETEGYGLGKGNPNKEGNRLNRDKKP